MLLESNLFKFFFFWDTLFVDAKPSDDYATHSVNNIEF